MKKFDKKDVFSWANCEEVNQYLYKEGYFAESISILETEIEQQHTSRLIGVDITEVCCFHAKNKGNYSLFLPIDRVKKPEKKWRAFTFEEFDSFFQIGNVLLLRKKEDHNYTIKVQCIGVTRHRDQTFISLGNYKMTLQDWFCSYEWNKNNIWQSFGVEE